MLPFLGIGESPVRLAKYSELPDLTDYALKSELPDLTDYATKEDLEDIAMGNGKVVHVAHTVLDGGSGNFPSYDFDYIKLTYNLTGDTTAPYTMEVILPKDHTSTFYLPMIPSVLNEEKVVENVRVTFSVTGDTFKLTLERNNQITHEQYATLSYYKY